jgi:hypothetical protein
MPAVYEKAMPVACRDREKAVTDARWRSGVRFGRPRKLTSHQRQGGPCQTRRGRDEADVARTYAVDPTTIGRLQAAP